MTTIFNNPSTIDLIDISNRLIASNQGLREKAEKSNSPVLITGKSLVKKIPSLKPLEKKTLISIRSMDGVTQSLLPCVYQDGGDVVVCLPDLNATPCPEFEVLGFRAGRNGFSILKYGDVVIKAAIACNRDFLDDLEAEGQDYSESEGQPDPSILKPKPQLEIPLRNIPENVIFKITATGGKTEKYNTDLIDIQSEENPEMIYRNVICNSELSRIANSGKKKFKITEHATTYQKTTEKNQYGKEKQITKEVTKTYVIPVDELDLSDLKL
ncbi:hypothetical protein [Picosynechococcus sp. PCC 11901]|nr:hypothetical protein [Picosynechococcus sp. PCC 11901]